MADNTNNGVSIDISPQAYDSSGYIQGSGAPMLQKEIDSIDIDEASIRKRAKEQYQATYDAEQRGLASQLSALIKAQTEDSDLLNAQYQQSVNNMMSILSKRGLASGALPAATTAALNRFKNQVMSERKTAYEAQQAGVQNAIGISKANYDLNVKARMFQIKNNSLKSLNDLMTQMAQLQSASYEAYINYLLSKKKTGIIAQSIQIERDNLGINAQSIALAKQRLGLDASNLELARNRVALEGQSVGYDRERLELAARSIGLDTEKIGIEGQYVANDRQRVANEAQSTEYDRQRIEAQYQMALNDTERARLQGEYVDNDRVRLALESEAIDRDTERARLQSESIGYDRDKLGIQQEYVANDRERIALEAESIKNDKRNIDIRYSSGGSSGSSGSRKSSGSSIGSSQAASGPEPISTSYFSGPATTTKNTKVTIVEGINKPYDQLR